MVTILQKHKSNHPIGVPERRTLVFRFQQTPLKNYYWACEPRTVHRCGLSDRSEKTRGNRVLSGRLPQIRQVGHFLLYSSLWRERKVFTWRIRYYIPHTLLAEHRHVNVTWNKKVRAISVWRIQQFNSVGVGVNEPDYRQIVSREAIIELLRCFCWTAAFLF